MRVLVQHLRAKAGISIHAVEAGIGPHVDEEPIDPTFESSEVGHDDGTVYLDQYTGLVLPPDGVRQARVDELEFAKRLNAFEPRPWKEALEKMGRPPFGTRWIDSNKGDEKKLELRSRLVVQETRRTSTIAIDDVASVTSATPPLEVVRLFLSLGMNMKGPNGEPLVWQFLDVSRAHPHVDVLRKDFYVQAPPEWGLGADMCLFCKKCWYGMRDASRAFEFAARDHFKSQAFE